LTNSLADRAHGSHDPDWFKRAVFYEVLVRGFSDSNGDGTGDLRGLTDKLDYLAWLGVDCLWLPPFYPSPLRDGGYDISDYQGVLPEFGTIDDFTALLKSTHERNIKVIIDFVMNHTSDQHPWFQASRSDPDGPFGNYYVWSDHDTRYPEARIIFVDTEPSNWTFDPIRKQYFWHRFFSHQPDLNFDSPDVQQAMIDALRFWLDLGIDGFRLDAVPYLFERDGTNGENLPETHEFLKRLRKEIDRDYPDRVMLCEANQWPDDVVQYFGDPATDGDECHMAFHFPVMPRIFMAVRREQRYPISEIMEQTPTIPANCQWGIFLRNHDELTLEMVSDEERDYMWAEYAKDPRMKANIGIRRRLAPLLENDINQIELFTALLLSLPGSPVLYYGDEIGMGDNIWLGDRDGVRTPMQWTPDRNAGFSTCDPGRLYLPVNMDSIYGFQVTNVESQTRNSSSLLHWMRRMIRVRKANPAFGLGTFTDLGGSNPSVLAFVRIFGDDIVLCVNNLSRFAQPVELDLRPWERSEPIELMGGTRFPAIGELPYLLTLTGHGFYWLRIPRNQVSDAEPERRQRPREVVT
jgi:maltose alpha-D-glucosyltransferase/alpha-amylase